jgi:hypothetical protein
VVVATCTKSLQDQLVDRDLPALLEAIGWSVPVRSAEGKQNYLCPQALDSATAEGGGEEVTLDDLRRWAGPTRAATSTSFPARDVDAFQRLRGRLGADPAACTTATCRRGRECFWVRARRRATDARVLVVNHALLALARGLRRAAAIRRARGRRGASSRGRAARAARARRLATPLRGGAATHRLGRRGAGGLATRMRGFFLPLFDDAQAAELIRKSRRPPRK